MKRRRSRLQQKAQLQRPTEPEQPQLHDTTPTHALATGHHARTSSTRTASHTHTPIGAVWHTLITHVALTSGNRLLIGRGAGSHAVGCARACLNQSCPVLLQHTAFTHILSRTYTNGGLQHATRHWATHTPRACHYASTLPLAALAALAALCAPFAAAVVRRRLVAAGEALGRARPLGLLPLGFALRLRAG